MRNLSKIIVLRDKNRPLYLPLKIEKNGNSLNKFFFILKFMEKYLLNKLIFMFSKNELFISYEQCLLFFLYSKNLTNDLTRPQLNGLLSRPTH